MKMKFCAVSVLMATVMGLAMTGCAKKLDTDAAVKSTGDVVFTATPAADRIEVELEDGSKQELKLAIDKKSYDPKKLIVDDYNFDGYQDVAYPAAYNEHNSIYQLWLYDAESGKFEEYKDFSGFYGPTIDAKNKKIHTVCYSDPVTTSKGVYEWRDGEMFCLEIDVVTQDDNGKEYINHMVYNEKTGEMETVEEEKE